MLNEAQKNFTVYKSAKEPGKLIYISTSGPDTKRIDIEQNDRLLKSFHVKNPEAEMFIDELTNLGWKNITYTLDV